jgi:hypothetical protein
MGFRISFGLGPIRFSAPIFRKRKKISKKKTQPRTYQASLRFDDDTTRNCHHNHRTPQAAQECGQRLARQL